MWARNNNGACAEFITFDPAGNFHPEIPWVEVPEALRPWADNAYVVTESGGISPPSLDHLRAQVKAKAADRRYHAEVGGITVGGASIRTDRESQALINGARALAEAEPGEPVEFKGADGWVSLDSATMIAISIAVGRHVRDCFRREKAIGELVDLADTVEEVVAIAEAELETGWPS